MKLILNHAEIDAMLHHPNGQVNAEVTRLAIKVETEAKRLVNVDNGFLKGSIKHISGFDDKGPVAFVGSDMHYALYQELEVGDAFPNGGVRKRAGGKAYLRPALQSVMSK